MSARSFNKLVLTSLSTDISRRGYATQGAISDVARREGVVIKRRAEDVMGSAEEKQEKSAWRPDPKTGYYRPKNLMDEIYVAELRAELYLNTWTESMARGFHGGY